MMCVSANQKAVSLNLHRYTVVSAANAAATATHAEIVQMQDAVMHQQKASMQEMHMVGLCSVGLGFRV
jgi:hypothetical protein